MDLNRREFMRDAAAATLAVGAGLVLTGDGNASEKSLDPFVETNLFDWKPEPFRLLTILPGISIICDGFLIDLYQTDAGCLRSILPKRCANNHLRRYLMGSEDFPLAVSSEIRRAMELKFHCSPVHINPYRVSMGCTYATLMGKIPLTLWRDEYDSIRSDWQNGHIFLSGRRAGFSTKVFLEDGKVSCPTYFDLKREVTRLRVTQKLVAHMIETTGGCLQLARNAAAETSVDDFAIIESVYDWLRPNNVHTSDALFSVPQSVIQYARNL